MRVRPRPAPRPAPEQPSRALEPFFPLTEGPRGFPRGPNVTPFSRAVNTCQVLVLSHNNLTKLPDSLPRLQVRTHPPPQARPDRGGLLCPQACGVTAARAATSACSICKSCTRTTASSTRCPRGLSTSARSRRASRAPARRNPAQQPRVSEAGPFCRSHGLSLRRARSVALAEAGPRAAGLALPQELSTVRLSRTCAPPRALTRPRVRAERKAWEVRLLRTSPLFRAVNAAVTPFSGGERCRHPFFGR